MPDLGLNNFVDPREVRRRKVLSNTFITGMDSVHQGHVASPGIFEFGPLIHEIWAFY